MRLTHLFFFFCLLSITSCEQEKQQLSRIEGKQIAITDSLIGNPEIENFIAPFREHVNKDLDSVISYAPNTYTKSDGELNTALGNLMADLVHEQANPIFKSRSGHDIDLVLLNHGGIRSIISKGNITKRTAYELMPFENSLVVVQLKGKNVVEAVNYLARAKRAHPISKLEITLDADYSLKNATVNGTAIDTAKTYYIATNDYLYNGGDHMEFFKPNDTVYVLNYKVRNAIMDYFVKTDTIKPVADNRFIKL